ncbi:MAG: isochorismatase family cysteine hydrolase [Alphaproteobacteria bacterium]|nr:isochorismatase family cysteine hydrolase [Alphaproteobacteria bacterium]
MQKAVRLGPAAQNSWTISEETVDLVRPAAPARAVHLAAAPKDVIIDLNRSIVVVVDMQKDFCDSGGWFESRGNDVSGVRTLIPQLNTFLSALRAAGVTVLWLNWGVRADLASLPPSVLHAGNPTGQGVGYGDTLPDGQGPVLVRGSPGAKVVDGLDVEPEDLMVHKTRFSGFTDSELDSVLRNRGTTTLLFTGINLDRCVFATLTDASFLGYDCLLVEDACATVSPEFCTEAVLYLVRKLYGFTTTTEGIKGALAAL